MSEQRQMEKFISEENEMIKLRERMRKRLDFSQLDTRLSSQAKVVIHWLRPRWGESRIIPFADLLKPEIVGLLRKPQIFNAVVQNSIQPSESLISFYFNQLFPMLSAYLFYLRVTSHYSIAKVI